MTRTDEDAPRHPPFFKPDGLTKLLRVEALAELMVAMALYAHLEGGWLPFCLLFLVPDLSMLGYLANARVGAAAYNTAHTLVAPAALGLAGWLGDVPSMLPVALIWAAHIAFDRVLGYGLKQATSFHDTHLATLRRPAPAHTRA